MLQTPMGTLRIYLNEEEIDYTFEDLGTKSRVYSVDRRVKINVHAEIDVNSKRNVVKYKFIDDKMPDSYGPNTGQDLYLCNYYLGNIKLSLGFAEQEGVIYGYFKNGMKLKLEKGVDINQARTYVAWLTMKDPKKEYIYTWFAADPTLSIEATN